MEGLWYVFQVFFFSYYLVIYLFIYLLLLLFNYSCLYFLPILPPTPSKPTSLPCLHPSPWFCPCILYSSSCNPLSPLYPPQSLKYSLNLSYKIFYVVLTTALCGWQGYYPQVLKISHTSALLLHFRMQPPQQVENTFYLVMSHFSTGSDEWMLVITSLL